MAYSSITAELEQKKLSEMRRALTNNDFFVAYQPIVNVETGKVEGGEALVRWNHPDKGVLEPENFIEIAEITGFIEELDFFVWEEVFRVQGENKRAGMHHQPILLNLASADLYNINLITLLEDLRESNGLDTEDIRLEVASEILCNNSQMVNDTIKALHDIGYKIIIDKFGRGKQSIELLMSHPIDGIKLDKSLVDVYAESEKAATMLYGIIKIALMLKQEVYCCGIEKSDQMEFLKICECKRQQGFYFSKALTASEYQKAIQVGMPELEKTRHKKGVLVIDDSRTIRAALLQALGDSFEYYQAENGREGLETLKEHARNINLIVTDIFMPVMDGFEFISNVQKDPIRSRIPVIVVTSNGETEKEIQALMLGAVDVIQKPYDPVVVRQRVKNVLKQSAAEWIQMSIELMQNEMA